MARRPKQSILDAVIQENWKISATRAIVLYIAIYGAILLTTNPPLKTLVVGLSPLGFFLAGALGFIAVIKFSLNLLQEKFKNKSNSVKTKNARPTKSKSNTTPVSVVIKPTILNTPLEQPNNWTLKLIQDLEWKRFEELSTGYYQEKGIKAENTPLVADGGIDIKLYQDNSDKPTSIVQCKAWGIKQVGVKELREFLGVMTHEKIITGFYMTSGEFSDGAKEIATAHEITLINGEALLVMIKDLPDASQQKLLTSVTRGDYITPTCPKCDVKMTKRSSNQREFWGCVNYPKCRRKLHLRSVDK